MAIEQDLYYVKIDKDAEGKDAHWWLYRRDQSYHVALFNKPSDAYLVCSLLNSHAAINAEHPMFATPATSDDEQELPL